MIIIIAAIIAVISTVIFVYFLDDAFSLINFLMSLLTGIVSLGAIIATFTMLFIFVACRIPQCRYEEFIKYQTKYDTINRIIENDAKDVIVLSDQIAEYNSSVLKGRSRQDSKWFSILDYDFYYDLDLIELQ